MKKLSLALLFLLLVAIAPSAFGQKEEVAVGTAAATAKVIFMRSTGFNGSATAFTTFIDDKLVCRLNNKRFSTHTIPAGEHNFSVQFAGRASKEKAERITIAAEAGKIYYIQLIFQPGAFVNNLYCQEVTESSAKRILPSLKEDAACL